MNDIELEISEPTTEVTQTISDEFDIEVVELRAGEAEGQGADAVFFRSTTTCTCTC